MKNKIFFFSDMDDTLIQTRRKTDFSKEVEVGAYNKLGEENSFYYQGTKLFIDKILESDIVLIPTTARSLPSYYRTTLSQDKRIKYAILNFGAMVLIDNKIDNMWEKEIETKLSQIDMQSIYREIKMRLDKKLKIEIIDKYYVNIHNKIDLDNQQIKNILERFLEGEEDFYLHHNHNSFAILPCFINKQFAVQYMINKYSPILTLGAGDNQSDLDFMHLTDFKLVPKKVSINML